LADIKVFVCYDLEEDSEYAQKFLSLYNNTIPLIHIGIDMKDPNQNPNELKKLIKSEYLQNSRVTVVLMGKNTWRKKYVDWIISSSLKDTMKFPMSGLIGIYLPTHPEYAFDEVSGNLMPARLVDNMTTGYASVHHWVKNGKTIEKWITKANGRRYYRAIKTRRRHFRKDK